MNVRRDMRRMNGISLLLGWIFLSSAWVGQSIGNSRRSMILDDSLPGQDPAITQSLRQSLLDAGEELSPLKSADLHDSKALLGVELLVLPSARSVPLTALPAI